MTRRRLLITALVTVALAALKVAGVLGADPTTPPPAAAPREGTYHPAPAGGDLAQLLHRVRVVEARPSVPGYDRVCGTGHGCVFGQAWSDDVDVALGHNGCDTRNDVLRRDLVDVELRPGTHDCVVISGELADPFTGQQITFTKAKAYEVGVDHVIPLARAWDLGAASWPLERRRVFANDPRNLLAVSGSANSSKSDRGPGEWLPLSAGFRCRYVARYLEVAIAYALPITRADHSAVIALEERCAPSSREEHPQ